VSLALLWGHIGHASKLLSHGLLALRRLLGQLIDGLADCILPFGRKLVQPVIEALQSLLPLGRKLIESPQPFLQPLPLLGRKTTQRFPLFGGRHSLEFFNGCLGGASALTLGAWLMGCTAPALRSRRRSEDYAARQGAQRQNGTAPAHGSL
jgi:hypothetical protein